MKKNILRNQKILNLYKLLILIFFVLFTSFGKNKVQYKRFNWEILKTAHFDIYYNKGERVLAEQTALILEDACAQLTENLRFELKRPIPVIVYNSHNDFEQSNVILELIEEGIGGFTEIFKSRIVVPFTGSYAEYRHVLHHELTHGFQYSMILGDYWESIFTRQFMYMPPLWFMEGMAEQQSVGFDREVDMVLKDATINNMLIPISEFESAYFLSGAEGFMLYKEGQGFLHYIAENYGKYKIGEIMHLFVNTRDFIYSFKTVIGKTHYELNKEWFQYLKRKYWPLIEKKKEPSEIAKQLTDHLSDNSFYNVKPVWAPDGKKIAILTDKYIFPYIVLIDAETGEELEILIKGGREASYEEMHTRENSLSFSSDGRYLVFISKAGEYDKINIYDFKKRKVIQRLNPKMDSVSSPDISPDNKYIVFSGTLKGKNDLFIIDFNGKNLKRLTDDLFFDAYPLFSNDGKYIIFTSNRDKGYLSPDSDIFILDISTKKITKIVESKGANISPAISKDGKYLAFSSDRDGTFNIYIKKVDNFENPDKLKDLNEYKITDVIVGAFEPYFSPDGKKIVFSSYYKMGQDIYVMDVPKDFSEDSISDKRIKEINKFEKLRETAFNIREAKKEEYKFKLTPDWIMGGFMYSSAYGFGGFTEIGASDILGNHRFMLATDFLSGNQDFNFQFVYYYLALRLNFGVGIFHFKDYYYYYEYSDKGYIFEPFYLRRYGVDIIASYPFNKFFRTDFEILEMRYIRKSEEEEIIKNVDANINLTSLSFVYDTVLWGQTGPIWGTRGRLIYQRSWALTGKDFIFDLVFFDFRKYFLISKKWTFAMRFQFGSVWGRDRNENKFYIGGFDTVRGHKYDAYSGTKMFLFNLEFRYPFVQVIQVSFPFSFNIYNLNALFFWDFGSAWNETEKWRIGKKNGVYKFEDLKSGLGWGLRLRVLVFMFRLDLATPWDGSRILPLGKWQGLFSIGYDF